MIDILTTSKDATRLAQVVRLIGECGNYRTTRAAGSPSLFLERGDSLAAFDVLIVDALSLHDAELPVMADLCHRHKQLTCILVIPEPSHETLIAAMRAGFRDVLSWPLDQYSLTEALLRAESKVAQANARETQVLSFMSCKGGAGTSFVASNVAHALSGIGQNRVLLLDLNQMFADAAFLLTDETPPATLPEMCSQIERMDVAFFDASVIHVSSNFDILAGAGDPVKAAEIKADRLEWILGVAVPRYDFVILDLGQAINQLSILALDRSTQIHLVLQASMPYARAARRLLEILGSLGYESNQMRLLLNRYTRHDERARSALEKVLNMAPCQVIPDDARAVTAAINQGLPIATAAQSSGVSRSLQALAQSIARPGGGSARRDGKRESLFARLRGRPAAPTLEMM
jgi:pilus assembly protein CpaE